MGQTFTSKATSINSKKAPAIYSMKSAIEIMKNKRILDIGGGRFNTAISKALTFGGLVSIYDPFNRTRNHNMRVLKKEYDVCVVSNVLNVIDDVKARRYVLQLALKKASTVLVTVYEGNGSGIGKQTGTDQWQENKKISEYISEIETIPNVSVEKIGKLLIVRKDK